MSFRFKVLASLVMLVALLVLVILGLQAGTRAAPAAIPMLEGNYCYTYDSTDVPKTIPDYAGSPVTSTITIGDMGEELTTGITVTLNITHTDLYYFYSRFTMPGKDPILLIGGTSLAGNSMVNTKLDFLSEQSLYDGTEPYTDVFAPSQFGGFPLAGYGNGVYELQLNNSQIGNENHGVLQSWSITVCIGNPIAGGDTPTPTRTPTATATGPTPTRTPTTTGTSTLTPTITPTSTSEAAVCGETWRPAYSSDPDGDWVVAPDDGPGGGVSTPYGPTVTPADTSTPPPYRTATPTATYPAGTPTPTVVFPPSSSGSGGLARARDYDGETFPGQGYSQYEMRWDQLNLDTMASAVALNTSHGVKTFLSVLPFAGCWGACPDTPYLPAGVPTVTYTAGACGTEYAPDYSDPTFRSAYASMVADVAARFSTDGDVEGVIIDTGSSGEAVDVYNQTAGGSACPNQTQFEKQVYCSEFIDFVKQAMDEWRTGFPDKAVILNTGLGACSTLPDWQTIRDLMANYAEARGIQYKYSGLTPGSGDAWRYGATAPYGRMQYAAQAPQGAAFEHFAAATQLAAAERSGYLADSLYQAVAANGQYVFLLSSWKDHINAHTGEMAWPLEVVTKTLGTTATTSPAAWVRFREWEAGVTGPATRLRSDWPGPFTHLASIVGTATATQYCNAATKAAATAGACPSLLSSPAAPESRNVLYYGPNFSVGIDISDTWQYGYDAIGDANYQVKLVYLDSGTDAFTIAYNSNGTPTTHTVTKANSGTWITETLNVDGRLNNSLPTGGDLELRTGAGGEYFNLLWLEYVSDVGGRGIATPKAANKPAGVTPSEVALGVVGILVLLAVVGASVYARRGSRGK